MKRKMQFAARKYNRNLSSVHESTLGFGELLPSWFCEQVIGDEVSISPNLFMRAAPQYLPNMASLSVSNRAFYVTYSSVWRHYNDFLQGNPVSWAYDQPKEPILKVPTICQNDFIRILTDLGNGSNIMSTLVDESTGTYVVQSDYDFRIWVKPTSEDDKPYKCYKLTALGKQCLKIFQALDYNFDFCYCYTTNNAAYDNEYNRVSALPLLCFFKVVLDYYTPSNLRPSSYLDNLFYYVNNDSSLNVPEPKLSADVLWYAFQNIHLYHDSNYFTSQWLTPTEPAPYLSMFGSLVANDFEIDSEGNSYGLTDYKKPSAVNNTTDGLIHSSSQNSSGGTASTVTQVRNDNFSYDQIKVINQLRAFIMRNNLVGSLPLQRLFARFGVKVPELQLKMAQYFGNYDVPIQSQAVVSTNGNDGYDNSLGDLAGMQFANQKQNHTFKINCNENGCSFVISSIDVPSMYVTGISRTLRQLTPFSFYTPEFDDSIMQATRGDEIVGRLVGDDDDIKRTRTALNLLPTDTYGFTKRYAQFKYGRSRVTGDYTLKRFRNPINGYILPRNAYDEDLYLDKFETLSPNDFNAYDKKEFFYYSQFNPITTQSQSDSVQFNRIYRDLTGEANPFQLDFTFDVNAHGNVKNNELDEFIAGDGDTFEFEMNGGHLN